MIRFIHCVKRRSDVSVEKFRQYWNSARFSELIEQLANLTGAIQVEKNLTLIVEANTKLMQERGSHEPFEGILEIWWDNAKSLTELVETQEIAELMKTMEAYQSQFVDFTVSRRFFTEWTPAV